MNVVVVSPPYTLAATKMGAASIHLGTIISILKIECGIPDVHYVDYNDSPFYLYVRTIKELCKNKLHLPVSLLYSEKLDLINRLVLENFFQIPDEIRTNRLFGVDPKMIDRATEILTLALGKMVADIFSKSCDAIILSVSPDISYTLVLCALIRKANDSVPIFIGDRYTFEPATPYFAAPLTRHSLHGINVETMLKGDPLIPQLKGLISRMVDWIIIGEGYDAIRTLFKSALATYPLTGTTYLPNGDVHSESLDQVNPFLRKNAATLLYSNPIDLDSLPLPDFEDMRKTFDSAEFELTRGCPYKCAFCERSGMFGSVVRSHSLAYMDRLMSHILGYKFAFYTSIDAALNVNENATTDFLQMLKSRKIRFPYQANLRGRRANAELIHLMRDTGCEEIAIGIETGDELLLESMNKVQNLPMLTELISEINTCEMQLMLFLIVGFPTETLDSVNRTLHFLSDIHSKSKIDVVEIELYHSGHIQALGPHKFDEYGLEWAALKDIETLRHSSYLFLEPGLYGQAKYNRGMTRSEINQAIKSYLSQMSAMGVECYVCHAE